MKLGQRIKLGKYINMLKIRKNKEMYSDIKENSSKEEISKFLREKLNLSKETIDLLCLDKISLFDIEWKNIESLNIPNSEKIILKNFLEEINKKQNGNKSLNEKSILNIFIALSFEKNYYQNQNISFYGIKGNQKSNIKYYCNYRILNKTKIISKNKAYYLFLIKLN